MNEIQNVQATELISEFLYERWPHVVPINAIVIMEGLDIHGSRTLFAISNSDCPPWSVQGMLDLVAADNRLAWEIIDFKQVAEEIIADGDSEDDDE